MIEPDGGRPTDWIRRVLPVPSSWHQGLGLTSRGLVVAYCGSIFTDIEVTQSRPLDQPPSVPERCPMCQTAYGSRVTQA
jgi:hypothetical protein